MGLVVAIAVGGSLALTPWVRRAAWKWNAVSRPDGFRRRHQRATAAWGGIAVLAGLLAGLAICCLRDFDSNSSLVWRFGLMASAVALGLLGCCDDLVDLRPRQKLLGQIVALLPLLACGGAAYRLQLGGWSIELGPLGPLWTLGWLLLGINALNLIDGMDGLATATGVVGAAAIAALALHSNAEAAAWVAMALAGALAGFAVYNLPPARIYLGDCGSTTIGLVLAATALKASEQPDGVRVTSMAAVLFLPLLDTLLAIVRRKMTGRGVMDADRGHIHHRLLDRGFSVWWVLSLLAALSLAGGMAAWLALASGRDWTAWLFLAAVIALLIRLRLVGHQEWGMLVAMLRAEQPPVAAAEYHATAVPEPHWKLVAGRQRSAAGEQVRPRQKTTARTKPARRKARATAASRA